MTTIEKMHRFDYTDVLLWISIITLALWIIGKIIGLIQSPVWVDSLPFLSALLAIIVFSIKIGRMLQKLDYVIEVVNKHDNHMSNIENRVTVLETIIKE